MDPQQMLHRLKDDDRWDGVEHIPQEKVFALRKSSWRNGLIPVAAALVLGLATAATFGLMGSHNAPASSPSPVTSASPKLEDGAALDAEFTREAAKFPRPLPDGHEYPTPRFADSSGTYPVGTGATMVASGWVCIWEQEYLSATDSGTEAAQQHAMGEIEAFATLPIVKSSIPEWAARYQKVVVPAKNGDLKLMREEVGNGNCPIMGQ
jgi:hypothetical protein